MKEKRRVNKKREKKIRVCRACMMQVYKVKGVHLQYLCSEHGIIDHEFTKKVSVIQRENLQYAEDVEPKSSFIVNKSYRRK